MEPSFYKTIWFWLLIIGIIVSIIAVVLYLNNKDNSGLNYAVGGVGILLIFAGVITAILRQNNDKKKRRDESRANDNVPVQSSESISDDQLLSLAAKLTKTTPQDLQVAVENEAVRAKGGSTQ